MGTPSKYDLSICASRISFRFTRCYARFNIFNSEGKLQNYSPWSSYVTQQFLERYHAKGFPTTEPLSH